MLPSLRISFYYTEPNTGQGVRRTSFFVFTPNFNYITRYFGRFLCHLFLLLHTLTVWYSHIPVYTTAPGAVEVLTE